MKTLPPDSYVHPEASVDPSVEIEANIRIECGATVKSGTKLAPGIRIGERVVIGRNAALGAGVQIGNDTEIGDDIQIAESVTIGHDCKIRRGPYDTITTAIEANVTIGNLVEISEASRLENGCRIGDNVIVKAAVRIRASALIGQEAILHAGCTIGENATVGEEAEIGEQSTIGQGATIGARVNLAPETLVAESGHLERIGNRTYRLACEFYAQRIAPAAAERPDEALRTIDLYDGIPAAGLHPGLHPDINDHWATGTSLTDEVDAAVVRRRFPDDPEAQRDALLALAYHGIDDAHASEARIWVPADLGVWSVRADDGSGMYIQASSAETANLVTGMLLLNKPKEHFKTTLLT